MSTGAPLGRNGMSSSGTMRAMMPLFPWRPAILSPTEIFRFSATYTFTSWITPGGSSSGWRILSIWSSDFSSILARSAAAASSTARIRSFTGLLVTRSVFRSTSAKLIAAAAGRDQLRGRRSKDAARHQQTGERADPRGARCRGGGARQDRGEVRGPDRQDPPAGRAAAGRDPAREGVRRREAQDLGGRQDGRPPRKQGHHRAYRAGGGHAVPPQRSARGHRAQPVGRAFAYERGSDPRDPRSEERRVGKE